MPEWTSRPTAKWIVRPSDNLPPRIMRVHYFEIDTVGGVPVRSTPESYAVVRDAGGGRVTTV